jgi:hypothetical protein
LRQATAWPHPAQPRSARPLPHQLRRFPEEQDPFRSSSQSQRHQQLDTLHATALLRGSHRSRSHKDSGTIAYSSPRQISNHVGRFLQREHQRHSDFIAISAANTSPKRIDICSKATVCGIGRGTNIYRYLITGARAAEQRHSHNS